MTPDSRSLLHRKARPRLLDLFCCEGGAGEGYRRAGFDIVGVDMNAMPANPHEFVQADALEYLAEHGRGFDAIHASPPCQRFSAMSTSWNGRADDHPDLLEPTRSALRKAGLPYVIENVPGAPLLNPVQLCGSSFGLEVRRHRLFESNVPIMAASCAHHLQVEPKYAALRSERGPATVVGVYGSGGGDAKDAALWARAMGIDWMTKHGLSQAIPPAYTEHIGAYLLAAVGREERAA